MNASTLPFVVWVVIGLVTIGIYSKTIEPTSTRSLAHQVIRGVAVGLNLIALMLELNVELQAWRHPNLHITLSWAGRVEGLAPFLAFAAILWPGRNT